MIVGGGILAFKDGFGIRPLVYGTRKTRLGLEHMIASESVALDVLGFELSGSSCYNSVRSHNHRQTIHE